MRRPAQIHAVAALVVAALVLTPAVAMAMPSQSTPIPDQSTPGEQTNATNASVEPGSQLAGVVGVGQAELDGAVQARAFGQAVAAAHSNRSKASVVARQVDDLDARLQTLQHRRDRLQAAFENGTIGRGTYQAKTAVLAARIRQVEHRLNRSHSVATALPPQARNAAGVNVSAIETLRANAGHMRGGAVAEMAHQIAGRHVGSGIPAGTHGPPADVPGNHTNGNGQGPPENPGPPDDHSHGQHASANRTAHR
ncbi:MAG: hypothetical protein ABEI57_01365 [Halapricum sp.]